MQITIPPIVRAIQLADYAVELSPGIVQVWVNPPRDFASQHNQIISEAVEVEKRLSEWYAVIWSKGPDVALHWTPEEVIKLSTMDTDPAFLQWLFSRTWALLNEHRSVVKKK